MANKGVVRVSDGVFQSKIRKLARIAKVEEFGFVQEQGGLYARDLAKATPPFAKGKGGKGQINLKRQALGSKKDQEQGQFALLGDLEQIFSVQEPEVIEWAAKQFKSGPTYRGRRRTSRGVAYDLGAVERFHRANQNARGRTRSLKHAQRMWVSRVLIRKYYESKVKNVGKAKAALAKASIQFGSKAPVPAWVSKHVSSATGSGRMVQTAKGPSAQIRASAAGLQHIDGKIPFIQNFRLVAMEKRLLFITKANAKKAGFKVR